MSPETIKKLCCPFDKSELTLTTISKDLNGNIIEGYLTCEYCLRVYPIISGIPVMAPDEYREYRLEKPFLERWCKGNVSEHFRLTASFQNNKLNVNNEPNN
ncbi:MAG: Trm112 family protein [Chitinophagales bacterium]|nr:Trm112 family protein [Chitinophagales bacterium]